MFRNLSFGAKIASSFAIVLVLTLAVGMVGYHALGSATDAFFFHHEISETQDGFAEVSDSISSYMSYSYPGGRQFQREFYATAIAGLEKSRKRLDSTQTVGEDPDLVRLLQEIAQDIRIYSRQVIAFHRIETEMGKLEAELQRIIDQTTALFLYDNRFVSRNAINVSKLLFAASLNYLQRRTDSGYGDIEELIENQKTELGYWAVTVEASEAAAQGEAGSESAAQGAVAEESAEEKEVISSQADQVKQVTALSEDFSETMSTYRLRELEGRSILDRMKKEQSGLQRQFADLHRLTLAKLKQTEKTTKITIILGLTIALLFSFLVAVVMTRDIVQPIERLVSDLQIIASGDMEQSISSDRKDEIGRLVNSVDSMREGLKKSIEEIQRKEKALRESEEYLKTAVDAGNVGLWNWEIGSGRAIFSTVWKRQLGYEDHEIENRYEEWESRLHPDDLDATLTLLRKALVRPWPPYEVEFRLRHKDGSYRWILAVGAIDFDEDDRPVRLLGSHIDNTERKLAEEARKQLEAHLNQAQKMESIGVLAGGIAHDFNNLLMAILGYGNLAKEDLPESHPARSKVLAIERAASRAADLTRQLLDYSGKGKFVATNVDVSALMEDMASLLRTTVPKTIKLDKQLARSLPPIHADASQIQQVVMNLITNAAEAIGNRHGVVTLCTGEMECSEDYLADSIVIPVSPGDILTPGTYVFFEIKDTGEGIDEATRTRMFEPFFTTKATGRGLGMAALLGIVRSHRGAIILDSVVGKGTTFRVLFPVAKQRRSSLPERKPVQPTTRKPADVPGAILVIDDEELVRDVAREILQTKGFSVLSAADGCEGVEVFREHREAISCVVLDLSMPNMSGVDCFYELSNIDNEVPVILSSGYSEGEISARFHGKKPDGFIKKPYRASTLVDTVLQLSKIF